MKNLIPLLFVLIVGITACHKNKDKEFSQIKKGMAVKQVASLVGDPDEKRHFGSIEWWMYNSDNKLIVIDKDTVMNVVMDSKTAQKAMEKALGN